MTALSYFQIYSGKENHVTNNTLLMFRHMYRESPLALQNALRELLTDGLLEMGPIFAQQVVLTASVPDGAIRQAAFNLFIEAKDGAPFTEDQIIAHLGGMVAIGATGPQSYLLAVTPYPVGGAETARLTREAQQRGIVFAASTFGEVVRALGSACAGMPRLSDIIADYEAFLSGAGLLPAPDQMAVFPVGTSHAENVRLNCYYEPASRPTKAYCRYIALYARKHITHVADMSDAWLADFASAAPSVVRDRGGSPAPPPTVKQIEDIVASTPYYDLRTGPHRFYLVDGWHQTIFRKASPGGLIGLRYLRAQDFGIAGSPPAQQLAIALNDMTFD